MMYVPVDLLEDLLVRLPVKSLGKFKSVSKEWKSILESERFVERHLSLGKSTGKILAAHNCDGGLSPSLLRESRLEGGEESVSLHCDATRPSMSCEGLVCIPEAEWIDVLNPSTGQLRRFRSPSILNDRRSKRNPTHGTWSTYFPGFCAMGFGRDGSSYKVVRMFGAPNYCDILDFNTGEWRKIWKPSRYKVDVGRKSACVNGSIYWLRIVRHGITGSTFTILALDLHTEEFRDVPRPPLPDGIMSEAQIVNLEDRLAIAMPVMSNHEWELEIWSMDAQDLETWSKTRAITLASLSIKPGESWSFTPVTLSKQGNVVFHDDNKRLFKYYQETNQLQSFSPQICVISPYLENLVPLLSQQVELRTGVTCIRRRRTIIDHCTWLWKTFQAAALSLLAYLLYRYFRIRSPLCHTVKLVSSIC